MGTQFLNVDLEIETSEDFQPLIDDLGVNVSVLYNGKREQGVNLACFEVACLHSERDADGIISSFCSLIENLSPESRQTWERSRSKKFDIGFESGTSPDTFQTEIRPDTLGRVAKLGAAVVVTIYPKFDRKAASQS